MKQFGARNLKRCTLQVYTNVFKSFTEQKSQRKNKLFYYFNVIWENININALNSRNIYINPPVTWQHERSFSPDDSKSNIDDF